MRVTDATRSILAYRRQRRDFKKRGYEEITCSFGIGDLWQLDRGSRYAWKIIDAVVGVNGKSVYVKAVPPS